MKKRTDLSVAPPLVIPRPFPKPVVEVEKAHQTVSDSSERDDTGALLQVRMEHSWSDLIPLTPEKSDLEVLPRHDGGVPLLDDMTGIRQWE